MANSSSPESGPDTASPTAGADWRERPSSEKIPCPALLSFYNNGLLRPDQEGNVDTAHLDEVLQSVGVGPKVRRALLTGADNADEIPNSFNLFALRDSSLDHSGSTGIRDPEVSPQKLDDALLKFSEDGRMYAEHFAAAVNQAQLSDPGIKGGIVQTVEFTALLEVFGRLDDSNKRYVTVDDVKRLWIEGKYPDDWQPRPADDIGVADVMLGVTVMAMARALKSVGL
jgi:hypothetical protein